MRQFSASLNQHLKSDNTTICTCWILKRRDGEVSGFTDHDNSIELHGVVCSSSSGFQPTQAVSELGLAVDNQQVEGALSDQSISEADIASGSYDGAQVEIWMVNWSDPSQNHLMRTATLGEISRQDNLFTAELRGITYALEQTNGRSFARDCEAVLGDEKCGFDLTNSAYHTSGVVLEVVDRLVLRVSGLTGFEPGFFGYGLLTWQSGQNAGARAEISGESSPDLHRLHLWKAMPFAPEVGDEFILVAGCDKTFATCKQKFSNHLNFRGFPHMPGTDFALGYAKSGEIHDGSPLIK